MTHQTMLSHQMFKSPTPSGVLRTNGDLRSSKFTNNVAIDPITLTINECMVISSAMRKVTRWSQSGVAAILGGGDIFGEDESISGSLGISSNISGGSGRNNAGNDNPLLSSFIQLRAILSDAKDLYDIDSLTILQPFLMIIKSSSTSGHITSLALDSIAKFISYDIISFRSKNLQASLIQINSALTHCRFEAADQNSDDAVLLKVLRLMESVITSPLSNLLPNEVVSEVIQTCLSLACNKKRSEVLRKAAEMTISLITARVFRQLKVIEPEDDTVDLQTDFIKDLPEDIMGSARADMSMTEKDESAETSTETETEKDETEKDETEQTEDDTLKGTETIETAETTNTETTETTETEPTPASPVSPQEIEQEVHHEDPFGIACINEFLGILISMISPSNQYQHMESTRVLALNLITTIIEVSGTEIPSHPSVMNLMSDPVCKHLLSIITTVDSPPLLQASLRLFTTMAIVLSDHLKSQIELTFTLLFNSIYPEQKETKTDTVKGTTVSAHRLAASKESLIESISLLWTREPYFFTKLFIDYDCDFDRSDLTKKLIEFICKLSLPEAARITTDNVPPICLEGLLSFISGVNERVKSSPHQHVNDSSDLPKLLINKKNKNAFIKCTDVFNEKPSKGIEALAENKFINDAKSVEEVGQFIFNKSGRLNKKVIGEYLAKPSNIEILKHFISLFEFEGLRVDEAIRLLLKTFRLPGESQQIERIVETFAERYADCQERFTPRQDEEFIKPNKDSVFVLSYSIILLNTDLHSPKVKHHMTLDDYKRNLRGTFNNGDYPEWYLAKIYSSIRDREIIMPEEHHGTDKWFDDIWHNLVSSQDNDHKVSVMDRASAEDISLYDKYVFEETVDMIIDTLTKVFKEASDDHIITRLMSTIDKCVNICLYYGVDSSIDRLIGLLADLTMLNDPKQRVNNQDDNVRDEIPITQIKIEKKDEAITVSDLAVWFGRDFKAQISTVVLFRLIRKTDCKITKSWDKVLKIIMTLFENCLINPNLFVDFQHKLKLPPLPKVQPRYVISRVKPLKDSGLLSTFSSFLKGYSDEPPEPTDQEVESTLSSIDCIKSLNIASILKTIAQNSDNGKKALAELLLASVPAYDTNTTRFYETETLFIFEIIVCFSLLVKDSKLIKDTLTKIHEVRKSNDISKRSHLRLVTYKLLLIRAADASQLEVLTESLKDLIEFDKELITKQGEQIIQPIISFASDDAWCCKSMLASEDFWKVLRMVGSIPIFSEKTIEFTESLVKDYPDEINPQNFMLILGLLDEVSSIGALASQWEQEDKEKDHGKDTKYLRELIELSKRSISLTSDMSFAVSKQGFSNENGRYPLIQALAHQCFNPCREVRLFALTSLKTTIIGVVDNNEDLKPSGVFEYGLFPLLGELAKPSVLQTDPTGFISTQMEALSITSKLFLQYVSIFEQETLETIWFGILDIYKTFDDIRNDNHKNDNLIKESGLELLKNMILVLQTTGIESDGLWVQTWAKIDSISPGLKKELAPPEKVEKVEQVEQVEPVTESVTDNVDTVITADTTDTVVTAAPAAASPAPIAASLNTNDVE